jgi:hypothetical protein
MDGVRDDVLKGYYYIEQKHRNGNSTDCGPKYLLAAAGMTVFSILVLSHYLEGLTAFL